MSTPESWAAETPRWAPLARAALLAEATPEEKSPSLATAERAARPAAPPAPYPAQSGSVYTHSGPANITQPPFSSMLRTRTSSSSPARRRPRGGTWARTRGWRPPTGSARLLRHIVTQAAPSAGRAGFVRLGRRLPWSPEGVCTLFLKVMFFPFLLLLGKT